MRPRQVGNSILGQKERRKASQGQKQNNGFGCGPRWSSIGIDFQICSISHDLIGWEHLYSFARRHYKNQASKAMGEVRNGKVCVSLQNEPLGTQERAVLTST